MAIRINFDTANNPEVPTIILAKKNGDRIGQLNAKSISISDAMNDASEITFTVHKFINGVKCEHWEQIVDFRLIYCVEWDMWFSITVDLDESTHTQKTIFATQLGNYELSQIMLYEVEINTENDIARDDYEIPTVLYNAWNPEASLLHRIMEKAPHYTIIHVDNTIANIQRTFSFDGTSIYDALQDISKEINCLFVFNSNSDKNGKIQRTISVYDLNSNCIDCGYRGEYTGVCPECSGVNIVEGYGEDTTIFITSDELADNIQLTTDSGSVKNCFKLEAGDDLMTATIRNCNPNGTDYIWYISDSMKNDMSDELLDKLDSYNALYKYYRYKYNAVLNNSKVIQYNNLASKYEKYNNTIKRIITPVTGYSSIMNVYYNVIDFILYLQTSMMPTVAMSNTSALKQSLLLTTKNLSPVAVSNITHLSLATADNAVLSMANVIVDARYRVKINSSSIVKDDDKCIWNGNFTVTNYSDETDTVVSEIISIIINDNYGDFVKQKINQSLNKDNTDDLSISGLFLKEYDSFVTSLRLYSLDCLKSFQSSCQSCIDILIEQGIGNKETWDGQTPNLYDDLYTPYINKLMAIESEIKVRSDEIAMLKGVYNTNNELITYGLQNYIEDEILSIQKDLNFQNYLGNDLWLEFCTYRREDKYSNTNYISDGLDNAELFKKANEFIELAQSEIYKSFELQHSISTSLKNLLAIKKFKPLVNQFKVGNWLRVMVDDKIYRLRLIKYEIDYDNLNNITVEFSDVVNANSTINSVQDVISQASSMATSYASVQKQAKQGEKSNAVINEWVNYGLDATHTKIIGDADNQNQTWDKHGMLFRKYDPISSEYSPIQLKIINSTIAITDDNWKKTKTAIGNFMYYDCQTNQLKNAYGINGEVIVGRLLIGQELGIYNSSGSLTFDENGLKVTNNSNTVIINPNDNSVFNIKNKDGNVLSFDEDGNLIIVGDITARSFTLLDNVTIDSSHVSGLSDIATSGKYDDLSNKPDLSIYAKSDVLDIYIQKDGIIGNTPSNNSTGFTVSKQGLLQASNAIIYGTLYSSYGKIGGWNISGNSLYSNTSSMDSVEVGTYIGIDGIRQYASDNKYVDIKDGIIKAVGGDFSGGKITSSTIESSSIFIKNNVNTVSINPSNNSIFSIKKNNTDVLSFDEDGDLIIVGNITAKSLTLSNDVNIAADSINGLSAVATSGNYSDLTNIPTIPTQVTDLIGGQNILYTDDISISEDAITDGITKQTVTVGNNTFDVIKSADFVLLNKTYGEDSDDNSKSYTYISTDGLLTAKNALIYGTIYATNGEFSGKITAGNNSTIGGLTISNNYMENGQITIYTGDSLNGAYINLGSSEDFPRARSSIHGTGLLFNDTETDNCFGALRVQNWTESNVNVGVCVSLALYRLSYSDNTLERTINIRGDTGSISCISLEQVSDENFKDIIKWNQKYDSMFMELKPISFTWKKKYDSYNHVGLGARETRAILEKYGLENSGIVSYNENTNSYAIAYSELHALEINAIQKNRAMIEELYKAIEELKG